MRAVRPSSAVGLSSDARGAQAKRRWFVRIDRWHPTPDNKLKAGTHWAVANKLKNWDKAVVKMSCVGADVAPAAGKRRVTLHITLDKRKRGCDPSNYLKSLGDALVACGALKQDSREWVEWAPVQYGRVSKDKPIWGCVIEIEEV